jgi:hypothetical protein
MTRGVGGHSPANIMKHLRNIHFPADKGTILRYAQHGPGPKTRSVLEVLRLIPDKSYRSTSEILHEVSLLKGKLGTEVAGDEETN